ncbi:MAG: O-antigen ligase family protein [Balneolaceae bacterium]
MNGLNSQQTARAVIFLLPFVLYEDLILAGGMFVAGLLLIHFEKIGPSLLKLEWREYLFFLYMFHMLFGERDFAYVGFEPLFVTEGVIAILAVAYHKELLRVHKNLLIYYLLVVIGLLWAAVYLYDFRLDAIRDSLMLVYAIWVPIVYHVFNKKLGYDLFFNLLKLFIVLKAGAYLYETVMILLGHRSIVFEGFRFGVGYAIPSLVVISLFVPLRHISMRYKLLSFAMLPAVFTMFHRSLFFGITLAVLLIFLMGKLRIRKTILTYGVTTLVVLFGFLFYYNTQVDVDLFQILERKSSLDEGNINFRFLSWEIVMEKFPDYFLLGYGVGRPVMFVQANQFFDTVNLSYFDIRDLGGNAQPHNSYLNILVRFGILIFPLFLYALWKPFERIIFFWKQRRREENRYYRFLLLSGLFILMLVFAFFNVVLESPHHSFPFWLAIGMILAYGRNRNRVPDRVRIRKPASS